MKTQQTRTALWQNMVMCVTLIGVLLCQPLSASSVYSGYTLFAPFKTTTTYLIDTDGNVAKTWESDYKVGVVSYILDDHSLYNTNI